VRSKDTFSAATDSYEQWRARRIQIVADGLAPLHSMGEEAANVHLVPAPAGAAPKTLRRDDEARGTDWLAPAAEQIVAAVGADFSEWCN
jgi:hypothetical protein